MPDDRPDWAPQPRSLLVVALLLIAAVSGQLLQPSPVRALNALSEPQVSPGSGTTATTFTFSVEYSSNPDAVPTSVVARFAGAEIPLTLTDGEPADGTFAGSSTLPAGSGAVIFAAQALGNDPTIAGPEIEVTDPNAPTPSPTSPPTPVPSSPPGQPTPAPTPSAPGQPTPRPSSPPGGATPPPGAPAPTPLSEVATATPPPDGGVAAAATPGESSPGDDPRPAASATPSDGDPELAPATDPAGDAPVDEEAAGAEAASPLALWLLLGGGMATIGLLVVLVQAFGLRERQRPRAARRR